MQPGFAEATVSAPLRWREVGPKLAMSQFTIKTLPERLRRQRSDPFASLLDTRADLLGALARLGQVLASQA